MDSWIVQQNQFNISQWDKAIELHNPQFLKMWRDPKEHFRCINELWNTLDAVKLVEWNKFLDRKDLKLLDLGAGTGWLSAFLSKFENVNRIYAVDSSTFLLNEMLPEIVELMGGRSKKINPIRGLFTPILLENESIDCVVMSSALHHAENMEDVLNEINRVLKKNGLAFILNETPYPDWKYYGLFLKTVYKIGKSTFFRRYSNTSPHLFSGGILYDPILGDRAFPLWFWKEAIRRTNFSLLDILKTPYFQVKTIRKGIPLTHFTCKKKS